MMLPDPSPAEVEPAELAPVEPPSEEVELLRAVYGELVAVNDRLEQLGQLLRGIGAHPVLSRLFGPAPKR